jgi:hypothetical protein
MLLASKECDGREATQALALLTSFSEILLAYQNQREKLLMELGQSRL